MILLRRLILLALALFLAPAFLGRGARAQQPMSPRFAFADTTLLRDTLDLKFDELFPLADSLGMLPDTLRALSIRYRLALRRLVHLADSLRTPVDSVGAAIKRERFTTLVATTQRVNDFSYNSGYSVDRQSTGWNNDVNYSFALRSIVVQNVTSVSISRVNERGATSIFKSRSSRTEFGWRLSRDYSIGARVSLDGTRNFIPGGSIDNRTSNSSQYDFSVRTSQKPTPNITSSINLLGGPYDEPSDREKRGFGTTLSGRLSYARGTFLTQDLTLQLTGRLGRARVAERPWLDSREYSHDLRQELNLFRTSPLKVKLGFRFQGSRLDRPDSLHTTGDILDFIERQPRSSQDLDLGLQYDVGPSRYLNLSATRRKTNGFVSNHRQGRAVQDASSLDDWRVTLGGRTSFRGWEFDARVAGAVPIREQPRFAVQPGGLYLYFREEDRSEERTTNATITKNLTPRITFKATGGTTLISDTKTVNNVSYRTYDDYRQSLQLETLWSLRDRGNTTLRFQMSRAQNINLLTVSTPYVSSPASNRETRGYRAEWTWTYRLLRGLAVNQSNQLTANYGYNYFDPDRNDLLLEYLNETRFTATVTPRLSMNLTHRARVQPRGDYTRAEDGLDYFSAANEDREYVLTSSIIYQPIPALSITLQPSYRASDQDGTVVGVETPLRRGRTLDLFGGATVNLAVGGRGRLSGNISRAYHTERTTTYSGELATVSRPSDRSFWKGSLQFSWARGVQ